MEPQTELRESKGHFEATRQRTGNLDTNGEKKHRVVLQMIGIGLLLLAYWWPSSLQRAGTDDLLPVNTETKGAREQNEFGIPRNPSHLVKAYRGAVATENEECSKIGVEVLRTGGNAVDAAIGATLCIGVVNMFSAGIGGGGLMVVRIPPGSEAVSQNSITSTNTKPSEVWALNFREAAPALANSTMYKENPMASRTGGSAVAIPGEIRGLQEAHRRWGSKPWKELVEHSAKLAAGWKVQRELARRIQIFAKLILEDPDWRPVFAPNGVLLVEGDWVNRTNYSRTLSTIAEQGPDAFYEGPIADAIIEKVHQKGGILTHEDLKNYRVRVEKPLEGTYHGRKVYTMGAPGAGPLLLQMLNVLENYDMSERTPVNAQRLIEAMKFAFASRSRLCDPRSPKDRERISRIPTKEFAQEIVSNITDDRTHPPAYYNPEYDIKIDHGTTHISVVDQNGMAVAVTSTIEGIFGSLVLDPVSGILMNDEMDDFSVPGVPNAWGLQPSPYNYPEPGKVPVSSMAPAIVENSDGSFYAAIGGSGGGRIFTSIVQVLLNLDRGLDASEAVEFGRLHHQLYPEILDADGTHSPDILEYLRAAGHSVTLGDVNSIDSAIQLILQKDGTLYAASDSRKNGIAAGY